VRFQLAAKLLEQPLVSNDEQWLIRRLEQVEKRAVCRPRVDPVPIGQQPHCSATARRFEQPDAKLLLQDLDDGVELWNRKSALAQVGKDQQFKEFDGRVAALGVAACGCATRRNRGREEVARVPYLQLSGSQPGQRRYLPRAVGFLQSHLVTGSPGYPVIELTNLTR
jgi:hypothetical protein